jgi:predicted small secreted protein
MRASMMKRWILVVAVLTGALAACDARPVGQGVSSQTRAVDESPAPPSDDDLRPTINLYCHHSCLTSVLQCNARCDTDECDQACDADREACHQMCDVIFPW